MRERAANLVIAVDVAEMGEPDYTLEDLHDEWERHGVRPDRDAVVVEDDDGDDHRLRPLPRGRPGRGRRSASRRRGCRHGAARVGGAARRERAEREAAPGHRRPRRRARARCSRPTASTVAAATTGSSATSTRPTREPPRACGPSTRGRARAVRDPRGRLQPDARDYTPRPEDVWIQRSSATTRSTTTSAASPRARASRSPAAGRTRSPTSSCSPSHPDHAGQGLGSKLLQRDVRRRQRPRASAGRAQRRLRQPRTHCALYERVGMTQALARSTTTRSRCQLGRQWDPDQHRRPRRPHADGAAHAASRPRAAARSSASSRCSTPAGRSRTASAWR